MKLLDESSCPLTGEPGNVEIASVTDAFFGTEGDWRYRRNPRTGHLWLDPRPAPEHIGELYRNYYTHHGPSSGAPSVWQQAQALVLARRLGYPRPKIMSTAARLVAMMPSVADAALLEPMRIPASQVGHVLDVGCGSGAFLKRLRDAGWQTTGIEPDPSAALRVRELLGSPVFGSIEEVEARGTRFDLIALSHVIEHVPDPIDTLRRLALLLAPDGRLVATTPNAKSLGARLFGAHWRGLEPPRHFNVFTPRSLAEAMGRAQLTVEQLTTHSRLARGIFYLSVLARRGYRELESRRRRQSRPLTIAGYVFQVAEAALLHIFPNVGEEIYCRARLSKPPVPESPTLGVVTVTFNAADHLQPFLDCCVAQQPGDFEMLVIDNASSDATVSIVEQLRDPRIKTLANASNVGYAAACNQAIRHFAERGIEEILFINNDTVFGATLFDDLREQRRAHQADAVTPRITYFSEPERNWYAGGRFVFWKGFQGEHIGEGQYHAAGDDTSRWTDVAPGCCILFAGSVFQRIGLFDENCFVYFEDTDYFLRMKRSGLRLLYAPRITIMHKISLSTGGADSAFSIRHYQRNQIYLLRKHFGIATQSVQLFIIVAKTLLRLALGKEPPSKSIVRLRAIREGLVMPSHEETLLKTRRSE